MNNPEIEYKPSSLVKVFNRELTTEIEKKWLHIYCKNKQGFNTKSYKWHIFSGGGYPSLSGEEAKIEYEKHNCYEYIVMANDNDLSVLLSEKPSKCKLLDYYVFPVNMSWTMAFTHEEGWLGPYFAFHPKYNALEKQNAKSMHKKQQKEIAIKNGWC